MDYLEVYNAIKTGVVDGLENESASLQAMKFYEVAPYIIQTRHAITVRPLLFSEARFQSLPADLQEAILRAGEEAAAWHRETEVREDAEALEAMEEAGQIEIVQFEERDQMRAEALPVLEDFAEELGALEIWEAVQELE
jgi:TRAP-type C4-dicarboxylate transport system substrate-binding protein